MSFVFKLAAAIPRAVTGGSSEPAASDASASSPGVASGLLEPKPRPPGESPTAAQHSIELLSEESATTRTGAGDSISIASVGVMLEAMQMQATSCAAETARYLSVLRTFMDEAGALTHKNIGCYQLAIDELQKEMERAVEGMARFIQRAERLHTELQSIEHLYLHVAEIKQTLDLVEALVMKLSQERRQQLAAAAAAAAAATPVVTPAASQR